MSVLLRRLFLVSHLLRLDVRVGRCNDILAVAFVFAFAATFAFSLRLEGGLGNEGCRYDWASCGRGTSHERETQVGGFFFVVCCKVCGNDCEGRLTVLEGVNIEDKWPMSANFDVYQNV